MGRVRAILAISILAALLGRAPAIAAEAPKPPPGNGAISVYIEQIPTSTGSVAAGASNNSGKALPKEVEKELEHQHAEDADRLKTLATSSGYGAPQPKATTPSRAISPPTDVGDRTPRASNARAASAPASAASTNGGNEFLLAALAGSGLLAAAGLVLMAKRRRSARSRTR